MKFYLFLFLSIVVGIFSCFGQVHVSPYEKDCSLYKSALDTIYSQLTSIYVKGDGSKSDFLDPTDPREDTSQRNRIYVPLKLYILDSTMGLEYIHIRDGFGPIIRDTNLHKRVIFNSEKSQISPCGLNFNFCFSYINSTEASAINFEKFVYCGMADIKTMVPKAIISSYPILYSKDSLKAWVFIKVKVGLEFTRNILYVVKYQQKKVKNNSKWIIKLVYSRHQ